MANRSSYDMKHIVRENPMSPDQRQHIVAMLVRDNNLYEVLVDTAKAPIKRRIGTSLVVERKQKMLADLGLLRWQHVQSGLSSFSDHYVITNDGLAVLAAYRLYAKRVGTPSYVLCWRSTDPSEAGTFDAWHATYREHRYDIVKDVTGSYAWFFGTQGNRDYKGSAQTLQEAKNAAQADAETRLPKIYSTARENPLEMGPNTIGWSIAALVVGVIAIGVAYYENKLPLGDKAP